MPETFQVSTPIRSEAEIARLEFIDLHFRRIAGHFAAAEVSYPVLISKDALVRAEYPQAFPHLLMIAAALKNPELTGTALLAVDNHAEPHWCLSPAVCYHCYAAHAGQTIASPVALTARGRCFRSEAWTRPGVRQLEFEMREIIVMGEQSHVQQAADEAQRHVDAVATALQITGHWEVGEDPFFLPPGKAGAGQGKAHLQRLLETKREFLTPREPPLALASINRHGTFFGERFNIRLPGGEPIHTACIAFGLDRWAAILPQESTR